jgi:hypothetical protein
MPKCKMNQIDNIFGRNVAWKIKFLLNDLFNRVLGRTNQCFLVSHLK